jgi:two-component system LytT family response regulator
MKIRAIVVDEKPLLRRSLLQLLKPHPSVEVVAECGDGPSAVDSITRHAPDVVFLDVQMPGFNGFEVLSRIYVDPMPLTIFTTAYMQYAVQAFEVRAIDYLLKPFGQRRFDEAIDRVMQRLAPSRGTLLPSSITSSAQRTEYLERIPVYQRGRVSFARVVDVDWIEAEKNHVLLHIGQKIAVVRRTLSSLEQHLNPKQFVRIHRSTIVNRAKVHEILPWINGYHMVVLETGQQLRMSRYQQRSARSLLGKEIGEGVHQS